ncbi:glycosyltransferase [bacterium]|nr:glycosyltransferase [bacterium]MBU1072251.1 glycosyltransferase [bacterium]MBU1675719.1 glycosyltransferase [bacterium]
MKLSIVIVHYNTCDDLVRCLESLRRCPPRCDYGVAVVDNASTAPGLSAAQDRFPEARWVLNSRNEGYARGCNAGMSVYDSTYVLLLNPDIILQPGAVDAMLDAADAYPQAGIIGPQLLNEDGSVQESCRRFYTLTTLIMRRTFLGRLFPRSRAVELHLMRDFDHRSTRAVDWVLGGCMLVRRSAVARVGPIDERFFLYFEDVDWCYRMWQAGCEVLYLPDARFIHRHRRQSAAGVGDRSFWLHLGSLISFYEKWGMLVYLLKRWRDPLSTLLFWLVDLAALNLAFVGAYALRAAATSLFIDPLYPLGEYKPLLLFANLLTTVSFILLGRYRSGALRRPVRAAERLQQIATVSLLLLASTYLSHQSVYSRAVLLLFIPLFALTVTVGERLFRRLRESMEHGYLSLERMLLVGAPREIGAWLTAAGDLRELGLDAVGYLTDAKRDEAVPLARGEVPCLGDVGQLAAVVQRYRIAQVVFWRWPDGGLKELRDLALLRSRRIRLRWRVDEASLLQEGARHEAFGKDVSAVLDPGTVNPVTTTLGRLVDVACGLVSTLLTLAPFAVSGLFPGWTWRRVRVHPRGAPESAWTQRLVYGSDGKPRGMPWQAPLCWSLLRGRLAMRGVPLATAALEAGQAEQSDTLREMWRLSLPSAGLTGDWAGAGTGAKILAIWLEPAGVTRFGTGAYEEDDR